jgi:hypothetical protein
MILEPESHEPGGRVASSRGQSHEPGTRQMAEVLAFQSHDPGKVTADGPVSSAWRIRPANRHFDRHRHERLARARRRQCLIG